MALRSRRMRYEDLSGSRTDPIGRSPIGWKISSFRSPAVDASSGRPSGDGDSSGVEVRECPPFCFKITPGWTLEQLLKQEQFEWWLGRFLDWTWLIFDALDDDDDNDDDGFVCPAPVKSGAVGRRGMETEIEETQPASGWAFDWFSSSEHLWLQISWDDSSTFATYAKNKSSRNVHTCMHSFSSLSIHPFNQTI